MQPIRLLPIWIVLAFAPIAACDAPAGSVAESSPETSAEEPAAQAQAQTSRAIESAGAPAAIGPYSQAVLSGSTLYLAGQIALDPESGEMVEGGIEAETHRVMQNLGAVLDEAGFGFGDVVQSQVFLSDLDDFAAMNEVYGEYFEAPYPGRATVEVARLPRDARVEIQLTAVRGGG